MSDGKLRFLSYYRRGAAAAITSSAAGEKRAMVSVDVWLTDDPKVDAPVTALSSDSSAKAELGLLGPGEVQGLARQAVRRVWPKPGSSGIPANLFPYVEFSAPDLPWRFTPSKAVDGRLDPWLVLLVLAEGEHEWVPRDAQRRLDRVRIRPGTLLPDLAQSWAWAHVQWAPEGKRPKTAAGFQAFIAEHPECVLSRLLCPRNLAANTRYRAVVVPRYHRGVLVGLGEESVIEGVDHTALAWDTERLPGSMRSDGVFTVGGEASEVPLTLPAYHHWTFTSGAEEDFESLAEAIQGRSGAEALRARARAAGLELGSLKVRLDLPTRDAGPQSAFGIPCALRVPDADDLGAPRRGPEGYAARAELLDALGVLPPGEADAGPDPVIKPPLYGSRHLRVDDLVPGAAVPPWYEQINTDPRWRAAAGIGAEVVRRNQRDLMAEAWTQYEEKLKQENLRRRKELARALGRRAAKKHGLEGIHELLLDHRDLSTLAADLEEIASAADGASQQKAARKARLVSAVLPALFATFAGGEQVSKQREVSADLTAAGLRKAALDPQFRRIRRPGGPLSRRLGWTLEKATTSDAAGGLPTALVLEAGTATHSRVALTALAVAELDAQPLHITGLSNGYTIEKLRRWKPPSVAPLPPPALAEPRFDDFPLADAVERITPELLLPGIGEIKQDTALLLIENRPFLEAVMVGATFEMSREMMWHELPTDLRGTCFRRFWAARSTGSPYDLRDICGDGTNYQGWNSGELGEHPGFADPRVNSGLEVPPRVILLIRARLFLAYPNPMVFAARNPKTLDDGGPLIPSFGGFVEPDIAWFGFDLTVEKALSEGWHFVLQESATGPTFGLDLGPAPGTDGLVGEGWDDLSWAHFTGDPAYLNALARPGDRPLTWAATGEPRSADLALITWQRPARVAWPAAALLQGVA